MRIINVVMMWFVNESNELLLARRADDKATDPGLWGPSVTGKLEPGETFEQALAREVKEELGLTADAYEPHFLLERDFLHPDGDIRHFKIFFAETTSAVYENIIIDASEVAEIIWLTVPEIRKLLLSEPGEKIVPSAFAFWEDILKALDK